MKLEHIKRFDELHGLDFFAEIRPFAWPEYFDAHLNEWVHRRFCKAEVLDIPERLAISVYRQIKLATEEDFSHFVRIKKMQQKGQLFIVVSGCDDFSYNNEMLERVKEALRLDREKILKNSYFNKIYLTKLDDANAELVWSIDNN